MDFIKLNDLINKLENYEYEEFHVHHTWKPDHSDFSGRNHIALQNGMRNYHVNTLGWGDIGQHISVFPDGQIVAGRDFGRTPASISGHNTGGFAMEMIGNFDEGNDVFSGKQLITVMRLAQYFIKRGVKVVFHREHSNKTCPGTSINKDVFMKVAENADNLHDWGINSWYKMVEQDVTDGSRPNQFMTREEFAVMADRLELLK